MVRATICAMYHPWRALRHLSEWTLHWASLPGRALGVTDLAARTITLDPRQLQAERRCTIAHEMVHAERGIMPQTAWQHAREESAVEQAAARKLIELHDLGEALAWSRDPHEVADVLWVDVDTLMIRMEHLHPCERHYLSRRLEEQ